MYGYTGDLRSPLTRIPVEGEARGADSSAFKYGTHI